KKNPRASPNTLGSISLTSGIAVAVTRIAFPRLANRRVPKQAQKVLAVVVLRECAAERLELGGIDVPQAKRDLLGTRDLQSLAAFDGLDVLRRLEERAVRPRVEPGHAATHHLARERAVLEIVTVHVGDLVFPSRRGLELACNVEDAIVVEIQPRDRVARFWN